MKKIMNHKIIATLLLLVTMFPSCKKDFLDVNKNPNSPETLDVKHVLPTAQSNIAYIMGNQLAVLGGFWAQYWTQGPNANQYAQIDQYVFGSTDADIPWLELYKAAANTDYIIKNADSTQSNYAAVAYFLKAYTFQVLADGWGKVPFTDALQGSSNVNPKYDNEQVVYDNLIVMIDKGLTLINPNKTSPAEDLIYAGDMEKWRRFANTLKLKIYLRQSKVRPDVASAGIAALSTEGASFIADGDDAQLSYSAAKNQQNPLYATSQYLQASNLTASNTSIDFLYNLDSTDLRMLDYYDPAEAFDDYVGINQGEGKILTGAQSDGNFSHPSATEIVGATSKVKLMTSPESQFLQAEAVVRGWLISSRTDKELYEAGITSSWQSWSYAKDFVLTSYFTGFLAQPGVNYDDATTTTEKVGLIITQKWVAMNGSQNFEAWTEWRRTGFPDFFPISATSVIGNKFPRRINYPSAEVTSNSNFPGLEIVTNPVWWDIQ